MTRAYAEPDALPASVRRTLRTQCNGEWKRVTVDDDGSFMVHNNAAQARRFVEAGRAQTPPAPPPPPAPKRRAVLAPRAYREPEVAADPIQKSAPEPKPEPAPEPAPQPEPAPEPEPTVSAPAEPEPPRPKREPVVVLEPPTEPLPEPKRRQPPAPPLMGTGRTPADVQPLVEPEPAVVPPVKVSRKQPAPRRVEPEPEVRALAHLLQQRVTTTDSQGVTVTTVPEEAKLQRLELQKMIWAKDTFGEPDWDSIDPDATAYKLQQRLCHGLPTWLPYQFHPEVESLWGMDLSLMGDALRFPQRVEIRPETRSKKYPVLAFYRGDLEIILGMRNPHSPAVIAAYAGSRIQGGGNGRGAIGAGGGSKAQGGLPSNVKASIKRLRERGAEIKFDLGDDVAEVKYQDNDLGKMSIGDYIDKQTVQSDYQRMLRKITAIDNRVPARR